MKQTLILLITLSLLLALTSCGREVSTEEVLAAMCASQPPLPAGQIFLSTAEAGEEEFADEELLAVLFGGGSLPVEFEVICEFAFRLSTGATPHEFAVFRCLSSQDAYDVAQMCLRRADLLRRGHIETEWETVTQGAQVSVCGKYVLWAVGEDAQSALETARRAIGGRR